MQERDACLRHHVFIQRASEQQCMHAAVSANKQRASDGMLRAHLLNGAQLVERLALQALHQQGRQGVPPQVIWSHLPHS